MEWILINWEVHISNILMTYLHVDIITVLGCLFTVGHLQPPGGGLFICRLFKAVKHSIIYL